MQSQTASGGAATILIVDDEEMLVELLRRMIVRQGYNVIATQSAREALKAYEENRDRIDLVITDLVMPEMDGKTLAEDLMRRDPDIRILVSTGFSAVDDINSLVEQGVKGVVMKPYQSEQLFEKIQEALQE